MRNYLPARIAVALCLETIRAVNRFFSGRLERHLAGFATGGAHGAKHFARATVAASTTEPALRFARSAAIRATAGGIGETFLGVEFLLACSEDEILSAIAAT